MESYDLRDYQKELFKAVAANNLGNVRTILWNYLKVLVNSTDEFGRTPLQNSLMRGYSHICKLLVDCGADANVGNETYANPVILATSNNHCDPFLSELDQTANVSSLLTNFRETDAMTDIGNIVNKIFINDALDMFMKILNFEENTESALYFRTHFHSLLTIENEHPVRLMLFLKTNYIILKNLNIITSGLKTLSEQLYKISNETLSWKCHSIAYFFSVALGYLNLQKKMNPNCVSDENILDLLIRSWLKGQPKGGCSPLLSNLMLEEISSYPFKDSKIYNIKTMVPVNGFFNEYSLFESCETCRQRGRLKTCSNCMNVQYCDATCQRLHWFVHDVDCIKL